MKTSLNFPRLTAWPLYVLALVLALGMQSAYAGGITRELLETKDVPVHAPSGSNFWDTGMRLCALDDNGNCDNSKYALSVARFGLGGAAAALISLVAFIIYLPIRNLCNGFGGKYPSYGICPSSTDDKRDYTRKEIISVKVIACIVVIPIVVGVAIGFRANSDISSSVDTITASLVTSGDSILLSLQQTRDILLSQPITSASLATVNAAVDTANTLDTRMHDGNNIAHKYDGIRENIMIIGFAFSLALVIAGVVCVIFNLRVVAMVLGLLGLLILTLIWLSFGIHLVAGKFTFDVCHDIDILTTNGTDNSTTSVFKTGALAKLWSCGNDSDFSHLATLVDQAIALAANDTCTARSQACYNPATGSGDPNWQCSNSTPCNRDTLAVVTDAAHMVILDNGQNRTLRECAVNCTNANYRNVSRTIVNVVDQFTNFTSLYQSTILPLLTCQLAIDVLRGFKEPLCDTLFNSLYGVSVSNLIVGIFYVPFIVLMIIGYKRFQSLDGGLV